MRYTTYSCVVKWQLLQSVWIKLHLVSQRKARWCSRSKTSIRCREGLRCFQPEASLIYLKSRISCGEAHWSSWFDATCCLSEHELLLSWSCQLHSVRSEDDAKASASVTKSTCSLHYELSLFCCKRCFWCREAHWCSRCEARYCCLEQTRTFFTKFVANGGARVAARARVASRKPTDDLLKHIGGACAKIPVDVTRPTFLFSVRSKLHTVQTCSLCCKDQFCSRYEARLICCKGCC